MSRAPEQGFYYGFSRSDGLTGEAVAEAQPTVEAGEAERRIQTNPYQFPNTHRENRAARHSEPGHHNSAAFYPSHSYSTANDQYPQAPRMSLTYDDRSFMPPESSYPNMMQDPQEQEDMRHEQPRYPSPPAPLSENPYQQQLGSPHDSVLDNIANLPNHENHENPESHESDAPSPSRSKAIPKPDREVTKDQNGRFVCTWEGCTEDVRDFGRRCEWSKHMDKHDRPYKCPMEGCEKLPGFTYSGGLLRHEREVHGKHGGPRKRLNCPHATCKRHTGKGFSRQENLNEHLRRVHTDAGAQDVEATEEEEEAKTGTKRKRSGPMPGADPEPDINEELKRLKTENERLRNQMSEMMRQIVMLQQGQFQIQNTGITPTRMPQASML